MGLFFNTLACIYVNCRNGGIKTKPGSGKSSVIFFFFVDHVFLLEKVTPPEGCFLLYPSTQPLQSKYSNVSTDFTAQWLQSEIGKSLFYQNIPTSSGRTKLKILYYYFPFIC